MEPKNNCLLDLLSGNDVTFFIPPYQRNYEWDDEQCDVFLDDIVKVARANSAGDSVEHFIGFLVYVQEDAVFGQPAKLVLVDGQQRVTTAMVFLMALRDTLDDPAMSAYIDAHYLKNNNVSADTEHKVKLKQVETDWPAYLNLVLGHDLTPEQQETRIAKNYRRFRRALTGIKRDGGISLPDLVSKGLGKFSIVTLQLYPDLHPWENPQEIFESMNSLGKPLSLADLVRNWLLMGKRSSEQEELYHNWWLPMEQRLGGQLSGFIRDYMQVVGCAPVKKATVHNYKELYAEFKCLFEGADAAELLPRMERCSRLYVAVAGDDCKSVDDGAARNLRDIRAMGATTAYSLELALLISWDEGRLSSEGLAAALGALKTYLLRRRIVQTTAAENKALPVLIDRISMVEQASDPAGAMFELFGSMGYVMRIPSDAELTAQLRGFNFYHFAQAKFLLALVEESLTKSMPNLHDKTLQLEHIMPQTLNDAWRAELGDDAERVHDTYLDTLGNMTLIRHNQELGNKSFAVKKETYEGHAGMQISRSEITSRNRWDEESIQKRAAWLADYIAKQVLPVPAQVNPTAARGRRQSITLAQRGLLGKTLQFVDDRSYEAVVVSPRRVRFEGKDWSLSRLTRELKTRLGTVSSSGAYQGPLFWEYEGVRVLDIVPDLGNEDVSGDEDA